MFTPVETGIGALLLHQATSVLLFQNGNVLGASGYMRQLFAAPTKGTLAFFAGMALSIFPLKAFVPEAATVYPPVPTTWQAALVTVGVGALVGWGSKLAMGCTSGHMLCGLSRLNAWSAAAVAVFFPTAIITHHLVHPSLRTEVCHPGLPCYTPAYPSRSTTTALVILAATAIIAARIIPRLLARAKGQESSQNPDSPARQATHFFAGLNFGLGLHMSQMSHPAKVLSFLSFPNLAVWDPSMALVILFGVVPNIVEIQARGFAKPPLFNSRFELPRKGLGDVDWRFVLGAAAFGVGWGLTGTCPGPAVLRSFVQPTWGVLWIGGFWLGGLAVVEREGVDKEGTCG